jgi:hypothetical protein
MRLLRWNSFTVLGVILLAIGVLGMVKGPTFQFDAGLPSKPTDAWFYLLVGVMMLVNGYVVAPPLEADVAPETKRRKPG